MKLIEKYFFNYQLQQGCFYIWIYVFIICLCIYIYLYSFYVYRGIWYGVWRQTGKEKANIVEEAKEHNVSHSAVELYILRYGEQFDISHET